MLFSVFMLASFRSVMQYAVFHVFSMLIVPCSVMQHIVFISCGDSLPKYLCSILICYDFLC